MNSAGFDGSKRFGDSLTGKAELEPHEIEIDPEFARDLEQLEEAGLQEGGTDHDVVPRFRVRPNEARMVVPERASRFGRRPNDSAAGAAGLFVRALSRFG